MSGDPNAVEFARIMLDRYDRRYVTVDCGEMAAALEDLLAEVERRIDPDDLDHIAVAHERVTPEDGSHYVEVGYWRHVGDPMHVAPDYVHGQTFGAAVRAALAEIRATKGDHVSTPPSGMTWQEWAEIDPEEYREAVLDHERDAAKEARQAEAER